MFCRKILKDLIVRNLNINRSNISQMSSSATSDYIKFLELVGNVKVSIFDLFISFFPLNKS